MTHYAVGDIQGCYRELMDVLDQVDFNPRNDCLWVAGDMVNRGPDSLATLRFLYRHKDSVRCVLGNHDLHLLAIYYGHRQSKSSDTLNPILKSSKSEQWIDWLRQQPLCYHDESINYTMVHAGIPPQWSLTDALKYSAEVEKVLQSERIHRFLETMYGNEPELWDKNLTGNARLRCITNYFTRMRICKRSGQLDLNYKGDIDNIPRGYQAWFKQPGRKTRQQRIIFGHWAALGGYVDNKHLFGLDTGCAWGQALTLMRLDTHDLSIATAY